MKRRIWELDALRGICILGVIAVHLLFDLVELYGILDWEYPAAFSFLKHWGGILFVILSGICVTLGHHCVRRGLLVFGCGMLVTAVTYGMHLLGFHESIIVYFGALHCLGLCMMLWALLKKCPSWVLGVLAIVVIAVGLRLMEKPVYGPLWLTPLGLVPPGFASSDYFPLLPKMGYFLLGSILGRTVYRKQESVLPFISENNVLVRFFSFCGRHSLVIYLLHQPILNAVCMLLKEMFV